VSVGFLLQGLVLGFSIAAPVGPIGVLCIRRTLAEGRAIGLASGLGAATADATYGLIAGFGLTFISNFLTGQQVWLKLLGGLFLCYLGVRTALAKPATLEKTDNLHSASLLKAYGSTLVLTLTNPATILSFAVIFAGLGIAGNDYTSAGMLVSGVFVGSAAWWLLLSGGVSLLRARFDQAALIWVNRVSGAIIMVFGGVALGSLLFS